MSCSARPGPQGVWQPGRDKRATNASGLPLRALAPRAARPRGRPDAQRAQQRSESSGAGAQAAPRQLRDWHDVDQPLLWQGDEEDALTLGSPVSRLPAPWKMMLLSDGSVTRHLQLLTGQAVKVECLQMEHVSDAQRHRPPDQALEIPGPLVQRQVLLWSQASPRVPLVYAASWWAGATVDRYLADKDQPIWVSLARGHLELYREIRVAKYGHSEALERRFGCEGPFWGRQYFFWHGGAPLTLIHEVFSNRLSRYLGPPDRRPGYLSLAAEAAPAQERGQQERGQQQRPPAGR